MIRPIDLQNTILAVQNSPALQRGGEQAQRVDAQAAQAALAAHFRHSDEEVAPTTELLGNRVDAKEHKDEPPGGRRRRPVRPPRTAFEASVADAAGSSDEPPHMVDFTA